jgi:hypothetical protein
LLLAIAAGPSLHYELEGTSRLVQCASICL